MAKEEGLSVWKIAVGIVLGLVMFWGLATCTGVIVLGAAVSEANKQAEEATRRFQASHPMPRYQQPAVQQRYYQPRAQPQAVPLQADERCIGKQKFRRVANGWEQTGSC